MRINPKKVYNVVYQETLKALRNPMPRGAVCSFGSKGVDNIIRRSKVESYNLASGTGKHVRKATKVVLPDGREMKFMEKMSKQEALSNAKFQLERHPESFE